LPGQHFISCFYLGPTPTLRSSLFPENFEPWWRGLMVLSPPATEETGAMSPEIESHQGRYRVVVNSALSIKAKKWQHPRSLSTRRAYSCSRTTGNGIADPLRKNWLLRQSLFLLYVLYI
jgi:hypothetical protein